MGGNVWTDTDKVTNQEALDYIIDTLGEILKIKHLSSYLLGSGMTKMFPLGDVDINMDEDLYDQEHIMRMLKSRLGENAVNKLGNTLYCRLALGTKVYQVDFMFGNYAWQKFAYAGSTLGYSKNVYRNMLLKAVAAWNSTQTVFENDELVARAGWTFMVQTGLMYRYRHRHFKRDGKTRVKAFSELILTDWNDFYREGMEPFTQPPITITNPDVAMQTLFNVYSDDAIFTSFETLRTHIRTTYNDFDYNNITEIFLKMCEENRVVTYEGIM